MALLFIDSFDHYGSADIGLKWSGISGTATIGSSSGRRGGGALNLSSTTSVFKDLPGSTTTILGAAFKLTSFGTPNDVNSNSILVYFNGNVTTHVSLGVLADGSLVAYRRTGSSTNDVVLGQTTGNAVPLNVYFYLEVKATIHATAGALRVLVNGVSVLNLTGQNTLNTTNTSALTSRITVRGTHVVSTAADTMLVDDLYIADDTGSVNNDFFGDVRIDVTYPNADGTYHDFVPDSGTTHFSRINEAVADSLSNVASSTVGAKDSYQFTDLSSITGVVRGVQVVDAALKDDAGARSIAHLIKSGVSEVNSAAIPLSTDRKLYTTVHETDPATGSAWTQSGINAAEFGVVVAV